MRERTIEGASETSIGVALLLFPYNSWEKMVSVARCHKGYSHYGRCIHRVEGDVQTMEGHHKVHTQKVRIVVRGGCIESLLSCRKTT